MSQNDPDNEKVNYSNTKLDKSNFGLVSLDQFINLQSYFKFLRIIILSDNKLFEIKCGIFSNLPNVESIDLSRNRIEIINEYALSNLPKLKEVNLSHNHLSEIEHCYFQLVPMLQSINLKENDKLNTIKENGFHDMENLEVVNLSVCEISKIERGSFKNLSHLMIIYLSSNKIKELPQGAIQSCYNLKEIDLHENNLGCMNQIKIAETTSSLICDPANLDFLRDIPNLVKLNLSHNKLRMIRHETFRFNCKLNDLDLSNNQIKYVEFGSLKNLIKCNLRFNPLKEIDFITLSSAVNIFYDEKSVPKPIEPKFKGVDSLLNFFYNQNIKMVFVFDRHKDRVDLVFKNVNPIVGKDYFFKIDFNQVRHITNISNMVSTNTKSFVVKFYDSKYKIYNTSNSSLHDSSIVLDVNSGNYDSYKRLFTNILDVSQSPHATRKFHSWLQCLMPKSIAKKRENSLNCAIYSLITFISQKETNDSANDLNHERIINLLDNFKKHYKDFDKALNEQLNKIKDTNKNLYEFLKKSFLRLNS